MLFLTEYEVHDPFVRSEKEYLSNMVDEPILWLSNEETNSDYNVKP
jgi:hypothetical protein